MVRDVGSTALGSQTIEASCVSVVMALSGDWTIATARLLARSIVWLYKRRGNGTWSEDYAGKPPKCWKGLPPDPHRGGDADENPRQLTRSSVTVQQSARLLRRGRSSRTSTTT